MATKKMKPATPAGTAGRTAAGFAPLALAVVMQSVLPGGLHSPATTSVGSQPAVCEDDIGDFRACHTQYPTGCSKAGKYDGALNLLKNRLTPPASPAVKVLQQSDIMGLEGKLPKELAKNNHADVLGKLAELGEGQVYSVLGYLYYAQKGGTSESSNCQLGDIDAIDYHIGIGFDLTVAAKIRGGVKLTAEEHSTMTKTSMIVEMTPHYRFQFRPEWTLDELKAVVGQQVKVTGQLLVDNEHFDDKDDCALGNGAACWRMSIWELHPVTQFQICNNPKGCAADSSDWIDLGEKLTAKGTQ